MLDYDPTTKLYLVKRVKIPQDLMECERASISRQSQRLESRPLTAATPDAAASKPDSSTGRDDPKAVSSTDNNAEPRSSSGVGGGMESKTALGPDSKPVSGSSAVIVMESKTDSSSEEISTTPSDESAAPADEGRKTPKLKASSEHEPKKLLKKKRKDWLKGVKMKKGELMSEDGVYHWVPRVRVMFSAEDPRVFANRVAYAHMTR